LPDAYGAPSVGEVKKESLIEEVHVMAVHVHIDDIDSAKYALSQVVGFIKGKSAIQITQITKPSGERP
jgi:hypothetical protein